MKDKMDHEPLDIEDEINELDFNEPNENDYVCSLCGYNHEEDDSRIFCEVCGMPMEAF